MKPLFVLLILLSVGLVKSGLAQAPLPASDGAVPVALGDKFEVGLRLGLPLGISFRYFSPDNSAFEGIIGFPLPDRLTFTGLYEKYLRITGGFQIFVGGGAHLGDYTEEFIHDKKAYGGLILGLDGIIGVDYTFPRSPFNLSLDWKPAVDVIPLLGNIGPLLEFAVSARYTFGTR